MYVLTFYVFNKEGAFVGEKNPDFNDVFLRDYLPTASLNLNLKDSVLLVYVFLLSLTSSHVGGSVYL